MLRWKFPVISCIPSNQYDLAPLETYNINLREEILNLVWDIDSGLITTKEKEIIVLALRIIVWAYIT